MTARRMAALLLACVDASGGDNEALDWPYGQQAKSWADRVDLAARPPRLEQLTGKDKLEE